MRWILVNVEAEPHWRALTETQQREIYAIVKIGDEVKTAKTSTTSLAELGVKDGTVFHLYGIALGQIVLQKDPINSNNFGGPVIA